MFAKEPETGGEATEGEGLDVLNIASTIRFISNKSHPVVPLIHTD